MTTPRSRIWFHEFRPNGPRAEESRELHEQVLRLWTKGKTRAEIAYALSIDRETVKRITWKARRAGDPRAFAKSKSLSTRLSNHSVLKLYREQYIVRGLAKAFDVPPMKIYSELRQLANQLKKEGKLVEYSFNSTQLIFSFVAAGELEKKQEKVR